LGWKKVRSMENGGKNQERTSAREKENARERPVPMHSAPPPGDVAACLLPSEQGRNRKLQLTHAATPSSPSTTAAAVDLRALSRAVHLERGGGKQSSASGQKRNGTAGIGGLTDGKLSR
jgi:hypothetical protein